MSDRKYVGATAAAKLVALVKAALSGKLDKSGGTIAGNLKVDGDFEPVKGLTTSGGINAQSVSTPVLVLHDNGVAGASASINVSGAGAVEVTAPDGDKRAKARVKVGTPTEDDDATTKAYVDDLAAEHEVITVTSTKVSDLGYDASEGAHKFAVTFDASFDSILANLAANKPMKFNITIPDSTGGLPLSFTTGYVSALGNAMYEFTGTLAGAPVVLSIGGLGSASVYLYADYLPSPNPDDSDDGKVLTVNKHKWEIKAIHVGGGVIVDTELSSTSTNPVQNKAIKQYVDSAIAVAINSAY